MKWLLSILLASSLSAQSMNPSDWQPLYSRGMAVTIEGMLNPKEPGWRMAFPFIPDPDPTFNQWGEIHYVMTNYAPTSTPIGLTMRLRLESSPDVIYYSVDRPDILPCRVRPMLQTSKTIFDTEKSDIPYEFRRWWSNPINYALGSNDNTDITLTVSMDPAQWSSVYGIRGSDALYWFNQAINRFTSCGFTFGGNFFGHGVRLSGGMATFILEDYRLLYN